MRLTCEELSAEGGAPDGRTPMQAKGVPKPEDCTLTRVFPILTPVPMPAPRRLHPCTALNAPTWLRTLYYRTKSVHFNTS